MLGCCRMAWSRSNDIVPARGRTRAPQQLLVCLPAALGCWLAQRRLNLQPETVLAGSVKLQKRRHFHANDVSSIFFVLCGSRGERSWRRSLRRHWRSEARAELSVRLALEN